jgi:hypothetical protein
VSYSEGTYPPTYTDWTPLDSVVVQVREQAKPTNGG